MSNRVRNTIEDRKRQLVEIGKLLRQYNTGAISFSDPVQGHEDMREIIHNGVKTGYLVRESLYQAVVGQKHPEKPRIAIAEERLYDLTPEMIEEEFPTVYEYIEDCVLYLMMFADLPADRVEIVVQQVAPDTIKYTFTERQGDGGGTEGQD